MTGTLDSRSAEAAGVLASLFPGDDEAAVLARNVGWGDTALGDPTTWSAELRTALRTVMPSKVPMLVWWGSDLVQIYNDAYRRLLGSKHPDAMGQPAAECWAEVWEDLHPLTSRVLDGGEATFNQDLLLFIERHGYLEETYWTFSYSPIRSADEEVLGIFVATTDVSVARVDARRLETVRHLAVLSSADFQSPAEAVAKVCDILATNRQAVPFAAVYLSDPAGDLLLQSHYGVSVPSVQLPERVALGSSHPLAEVAKSRQPRVTTYEADLLGAEPGPLGPKVPNAAYLLPLDAAGHRLEGLLVLGLNPYRQVDGRYTTFVTLVTRQLIALLTDVRVTAGERARVAALSELDRNKSAFFANVSHEFRTPITVALSATRELQSSDLDPEQARHVEAVDRAAHRLNRLVDAVLDFARAEAGSLNPILEPVDVTAVTRDVVGMFRSAIESAGLRLGLDIDEVGLLETDRESWFKIVGNLLSNAYKFTPAGSINVALHRDDQRVTLSVSDTGSGITPEEATAVLDRFHQASGRPARGITGTGIGLALVKDLVEAQDGRLQLESTPGSGTTVTVMLPASGPSTEVGHDVPVDTGMDAPQVIGALLQELTPPETDNRRVTPPLEGEAPRVLLVEDNADLRDYLTRLLGSDGWAVSAAPDVTSALEIAGDPDIILCDVMLPGPSGLDLTRMVRSRTEWASIPVVLLTARSGPGEVAEGLSAGADDYVSKPFQPIELLSRLRAHYELARDRNRQLLDAQDKSSHLEVAVISNRHIGVAIGVLMASQKVTSEDAFDLLRRVSNRTNRKLRDIAEQVALTGQLPQAGTQKQPARRG